MTKYILIYGVLIRFNDKSVVAYFLCHYVHETNNKQCTARHITPANEKSLFVITQRNNNNNNNKHICIAP